MPEPTIRQTEQKKKKLFSGDLFRKSPQSVRNRIRAIKSRIAEHYDLVGTVVIAAGGDVQTVTLRNGYHLIAQLFGKTGIEAFYAFKSEFGQVLHTAVEFLTENQLVTAAVAGMCQNRNAAAFQNARDGFLRSDILTFEVDIVDILINGGLF